MIQYCSIRMPWRVMISMGYVFACFVCASAQTPDTTHPPSDKSLITIFLSKDMSADLPAVNKLRVYVDGYGRRLPGNRFFSVSVPPGKHVLRSGAGFLDARREELDLDLKAGEHIYVLEGLEVGAWRGRIALRTVQCDEMRGVQLVQHLKPLKHPDDGVLSEAVFPACQ